VVGVEYVNMVGWSPIFGCTKVSSGCDHCAERLVKLTQHPWVKKHHVEVIDGDGDWTGEVVFMSESLDIPFNIEPPALFNVGHISDMFHPGVTDDYRAAIFGVMAKLPRHHFVVTTRRIQAAKEWLADENTPASVAVQADRWADPSWDSFTKEWPLPNVTFAVSVEDQEHADAMIPVLMDSLADRRLVRCSPMMGAIDLAAWPELDWVSVTAPIQDKTVLPVAWVKAVADFCNENAIPLTFRGWGSGFPEMMTAEHRVAAVGRKISAAQMPGRACRMVGGNLRNDWPGF